MRTPKEIIKIQFNSKIGNLTVGEMVRYVQNHPLFLTTPQSYITHGRLYECTCSCGQQALFSEYVLARQMVKSCGCIRRQQTEEAIKLRDDKAKIDGELEETKFHIKQLQKRLKQIQLLPSGLRDSKEINLETTMLSKDLRYYIAMKATLVRKRRLLKRHER